MKTRSVFLGLGIAGMACSERRAMPIPSLPKASPLVVPAVDGCGGGRYGDRAARAIGSGAGLIRAAIVDPIADLTEPGTWGPGRDPETAAGRAGIAVPTGHAIGYVEGHTPEAITAPIMTNRVPICRLNGAMRSNFRRFQA
jgi:hypothetical protein